VRDVLGYVTFENFLSQASVSFGLNIGFFCFFVLFWMVLAMLCFYGSDVHSISQFEQILGNIIGFMIMLLKTVLIIPFLFIVLNSFK
jgi:uncharacterized membrane protein YcjF (UPF0283 family)